MFGQNSASEDALNLFDVGINFRERDTEGSEFIYLAELRGAEEDARATAESYGLPAKSSPQSVKVHDPETGTETVAESELNRHYGKNKLVIRSPRRLEYFE